MRTFDYAGSTALITGASRGIGAALARDLSARGVAGLILTARTEPDLQNLARELQTQRPELKIEIIAADLGDPAAPEAIKAETDRRNLTVDLLINNAGFGSAGPFDTLDLERERSMVQVNITSLLSLTRLYYPGMLARGRGGIINVGSTAGFMPAPFMATYAATKAFVQSFSEALWAENQDLNNDIRILCLCPGGTETNFGHAVGAKRGKFEEAPHSTPEEVAAAGLDALERGEMYCVVGIWNQAMATLPRLLPRPTIARVGAEVLRPEGRENLQKNQERAALLLTALTGVALVAAGIALVTQTGQRVRPGTAS